MLVLCPSNSPGIRMWGLYLSFTGEVAFPLHLGGIFSLKGSAPSRVHHLATTSTKSTVTECVKRVMVVPGG